MIIRFFKGRYDILGRVTWPHSFLLNLETRYTIFQFIDALYVGVLRVPKGGRIEISAE
jgi:hypothetical protein